MANCTGALPLRARADIRATMCEPSQRPQPVPTRGGRAPRFWGFRTAPHGESWRHDDATGVPDAHLRSERPQGYLGQDTRDAFQALRRLREADERPEREDLGHSEGR